MHMFYDEDEFETVVHSRPCTSCGGQLGRCRGIGCNGSFGVGTRRRSKEAVHAIKTERQRKTDLETLELARAALTRQRAIKPEERPAIIAQLVHDLAQFTD